MKRSQLTSEYLVMYAHCIPIKGKEQGAIYNFHTGNIIPVPNSMIALIDYMKIYTTGECKDIVDSEASYWEYFNYLKQNDLAFLTSEPTRFPPIKPIFYSPECVKQAVIEYVIGGFDDKKLFSNLNTLLCKHVELRLPDNNLTSSQLETIISNTIKSTIRSIDIHCKFNSLLNETDLESLTARYKKINFINLYGAPNNNVNAKSYIRFTTADYETLITRNFPKDVLIVNMPYFSESHDYNPYYNKKICVDKNGNIKNCLRHKKTFGNIDNSNEILNIHNNDDFTFLWKIKPDLIEGVKESELRYCTLYSQNVKVEHDKIYLIDE